MVLVFWFIWLWLGLWCADGWDRVCFTGKEKLMWLAIDSNWEVRLFQIQDLKFEFRNSKTKIWDLNDDSLKIDNSMFEIWYPKRKLTVKNFSSREGHEIRNIIIIIMLFWPNQASESSSFIKGQISIKH